MLNDRIREIVGEYYPENPKPTFYRRLDGAGKWELIWCESLESLLFMFTPRVIINSVEAQRIEEFFANLKTTDFDLMFDKMDDGRIIMSYSLFVWYHHKPARFKPERLFQDVTILLYAIEVTIIQQLLRRK